MPSLRLLPRSLLSLAKRPRSTARLPLFLHPSSARGFSVLAPSSSPRSTCSLSATPSCSAPFSTPVAARFLSSHAPRPHHLAFRAAALDPAHARAPVLLRRRCFSKEAAWLSNDRIKAKEMLVIDVDGSKLGVISREEALGLAAERGVDLVEVGPGLEPPTCKLMDMNKTLFIQNKARREKKKQTSTVPSNKGKGVTKEVVVKSKIEGRDMERQLDRAAEFLQDGSSVKFTVVLLPIRRRAGHTSVEEREERVAKLVSHMRQYLGEQVGSESQPIRRGNRVSLVLATPKKKA